MKYVPLIMLVCVTSFADDAAIPKSNFSAAGHSEDNLADVKARVTNKSAVLLDVREIDEWKEGHLKHAKLMPLSMLKKGELTAKMKESLTKDKPIYLHCAAGGRVLAVSKLLRDKGYDIRPLKQGYDDLLQKGFEKAVEITTED